MQLDYISEFPFDVEWAGDAFPFAMFWSNLGHFFQQESHPQLFPGNLAAENHSRVQYIRDWYKDFLNSIRGSFSRGCDSFRVTPGCLTCFLCRLHVFWSMCDQCVWFCAANRWRLAGTADSFCRHFGPTRFPHGMPLAHVGRRRVTGKRAELLSKLQSVSRPVCRLAWKWRQFLNVFNSSVYVHGSRSCVRMCMPLITFRLSSFHVAVPWKPGHFKKAFGFWLLRFLASGLYLLHFGAKISDLGAICCSLEPICMPIWLLAFGFGFTWLLAFVFFVFCCFFWHWFHLAFGFWPHFCWMYV